jgi:hypothetical protein
MHLVLLGWMFVVVLMAAAEATAPDGTVLGALVTFALYGVVPLSIVLYILGTPMRRRAQLRGRDAPAAPAPVSAEDRDGGGHPPGAPVAPEREEP